MSASESQNQTGPLKAPYFYLSHARADDESSVHDFFTDLSNSIRFKAKPTSTEVVGRWNTSPQERDEGLRTSRVMIALLSPAYLRDEAALLEWKIFELREGLANRPSNGETLKRSIIPICWSPCSGSMPMEISQTPLFEGDLKSGPNVTDGVQSLANNQRAAFVNSLARYIIEVTSSFQLTPLESIPDEIPNAFEDREELEMNSQPTNPSQDEKINNRHKIVNKNKLIIDGTFVKALAEQIKETAATPVPVSAVGLSGQITQPTKVANEKYVVFTIDDKPEDMQKIEIPARLSPYFDVTPYTDFNKLVDDVSALLEDRKEPDLIVVNPALTDPKTHNFTLIKTLLDKKVPSAILATSKDPDAVQRIKQAGINDLVAVLPESPTSVELLQLMRHWARIGRDKRHRRGRSDQRPVFLSFASPDEPMASQICKWLELREIGVWYSYETLEPGDEWIEKIKQGLASAEVFVVLISDHYPESDYCQGELGNILVRMANESIPPRIIPVHYHNPTVALEDRQIKTHLKQQAVKIPSDMDWLLGCGEILKAVQNFLKPRQILS